MQDTFEDSYENIYGLTQEKERDLSGGLRKKKCFKESLSNKPLITVITVVFNDEKNLEKTIKSIINQTYKNIEYIIVDGGSTDQTLEIIHKYEDRIDYWITENDKGIYDAMNKGVSLARGEWINFMNSGDIFFDKETIAKINFDRDKNINVLYGDAETEYTGFSKIYKAGNLRDLPYSMQFSHQSAFFRTAYHQQNLFTLKYKFASDFYLILQLFINNPDSFAEVPIVISSVSVGGISDKKTYLSVYERWLIVKELEIEEFSVNTYYFRLLIKQIIKSLFVNDSLLNWYRAFKLKR
jgi:glycosyltransferase involved in cell wall biosynthesis